MTRFTTGFYRQGAATLYVNRGLGTTGPPVRLAVPPEIALLTLRRAAGPLGAGLEGEAQAGAPSASRAEAALEPAAGRQVVSGPRARARPSADRS